MKLSVGPLTTLNVSLGRPSRWLFALSLALIGGAVLPTVIWAQALAPELRDRFLSDPEVTEPRDPLLPTLPIDRRLSPLERSELAVALDELAAEAQGLYFQGQIDLAFQLWIREVRLRRILGYAEEIEAMQRVGLLAWENARTPETQLLTLRLRQIQTDLLSQEPPDFELLKEVAATFEVLRDVDSAIAVYETLIARATQRGNPTERQRLLESLANLQESWFRFEAAGRTYQNLINTISSSGDPITQVVYLRGAIRNYQETDQLRIAIEYQRQLLRLYEETLQVQLIPPLMLAIARNYQALEELTQARTYYQATYTVALAQNQSSIASEAVEDLARIYTQLNRPDDVRYLYEQQIAVERLSYNAYGLMQVFDRLGQLYEAQSEFENAATVYQEAFVLANHLGHQKTYFRYRLQQLLLKQGKLTVTPAEQHQSSQVGDLQSPDFWEGNGFSPENPSLEEMSN